ncbi:MAG: hypothetical protein Q7T60_09555 [Sphingopyxis sp.]|nr:hypothetical protein [Sphingopyxis sp.]
MSKKILFVAAFLVCMVVSGLIGGVMSRHFAPSSLEISYVDFISIMLTSLGIILTALAVFIGILAVLGWNSIEDKLRDHSHDYIRRQLEEGNPLRDDIRRSVREVVYEGVAAETEIDDERFEDLPAGERR